jgi:hypothetical protein
LTEDDLLLLDQQSSYEETDNDAEERDNVQVKEFGDIFRAVEVVKQKIWMLTLTSIEACKVAAIWITHSASTSMCMKIYIKRRQSNVRC